ncbi:hypothetical protein ABWW58_08885 [Sporolactobacillus sp. STCC-11]|uniref:hypothetical protein n=1 Tax=Sporolactobacillus caesalpiniae TaxID=3230362 RepID=UPI00339479A6
MQLTIVPISQIDSDFMLPAYSKVKLCQTMNHMQLEIDRLNGSKLALDEAKKIILIEQLEGMKMALNLTGYRLIYH